MSQTPKKFWEFDISYIFHNNHSYTQLVYKNMFRNKN